MMLLAVLLLMVPAIGLAGESNTDEYKLKAALIYKLTKFIEWPDGDKPADPESFGVCVVGGNPFGDALKALEKLTVRRIPITIYDDLGIEGIQKYCAVVFINEPDKDVLVSIILALKQFPVLTISDINGFAEKGGMIQLAKKEKRIRLRINLDSSRYSGLKISSQLLMLSTLVRSTQDRPGLKK